MTAVFPKISVVTITYGHEKYIRETLDGVMMQQYPGPVEFIIANDNSPDNTDEVVKNYFNEKPAPENFEIKYTRHAVNKGMSENFVWALQQSTGKYIAFCEGDDYWTDGLKLYTQVSFLELKADYVLCFTNRNILDNGIVEISKPICEKQTFDISEIPSGYVPTLTAVFRNVVAEIPPKMSATLIDSSLFLFLSQYGSFYYMDVPTAIYRVHEGGIYSGSSQLRNYKRSVEARMAAWRHLKNIDKIKLTYVIRFWNDLKKSAAIKDKDYFTIIECITLDRFLDSYILARNIYNKIKFNKNK